jgi:hypothetical protein
MAWLSSAALCAKSRIWMDDMMFSWLRDVRVVGSGAPRGSGIGPARQQLSR